MDRDTVRGFSDVDKATDPSSFVGYLEATTAQEFSKEYKQETYDRLQVKAGDSILDVGCGMGDDVRALAQIVGPGGSVTGVDSSETMIAECKKRTDGLGLPIEFYVGDACNLEFADDTFDGSRADRTFQHIEDVSKAVSELVRVTKPGGRIVVIDPDWETLVINHPDRSLTRRILNVRTDRFRNGWCGRKLYRLFKQSGLRGVDVIARTFMLVDYPVASNLFQIQESVEWAQQAGLASTSEGKSWLTWLEEEYRGGRFFAAVTLFAAIGTKA